MFEGPRSKADWAKKHIHNLDAAFSAYASRNPWVFVIEPHANPKACKIVVRNREKPPADFTLMVGDAIHNLRTALDYLACDIVRPTVKNAEELAETYFPLVKKDVPDPNDLKSRFAQTKIDRASKKIMDVFWSLDLGKRGDLYALHALDIEDKHRNLLGIGSAGVAPDIHSQAITIINTTMLGLRDGQVFIDGLPIPVNAKMGDKFTAAIYIHFGSGLPFERQPAIKKLLELAKMVNGIIDAIEMASN